MERKIIITLKDPLWNGEEYISTIHCDEAYCDNITPKGVVEYKIDGKLCIVSLDSIRGYITNVNYKENQIPFASKENRSQIP